MTATIKGGLTPVNKLGGGPANGAISNHMIDNAYGTAIGSGALVKIGTDGYVQLAVDGDDVIGVFAGCYYIDATSKRPVQSPNFVAGTSNDAPIGDIVDVIAYVYSDPNQEFMVEADASAAQTNIGESFRTTGNGTVDSYGRSATQLDVGAAVSSNDMLLCTGLAELAGNAIGDANPVLRVKLTRHALARQS